jgi:hypothetical protein
MVNSNRPHRRVRNKPGCSQRASVEAIRVAIGNKTGAQDVLNNNAAISAVQFDAGGNMDPRTRTATDTSINILRDLSKRRYLE